MKSIQCKVIQNNGTISYVAAYLAAPGLAVHREIWSGALAADSRHWEITHISSGYSAMPGGVDLRTRREAARLARCLAEDVDWTEDGATLYRDLSFKTHIAPSVERFKAGHDPEKHT